MVEGGNQYSRQWRIWTQGYNLIASIRHQNNEHSRKVNFHFAQDDGYNHYTTIEYDAKEVKGNEVTPLDCLSWYRSATPPQGEKMLHLMSVIFPHSMVNVKPYQADTKKPVYELPRPGEGKSWVVSLHLASPPLPNHSYAWIETDDYKVLDCKTFLHNELAVVLARRVPFDEIAFWEQAEAGINQGIQTGRWLIPLTTYVEENMHCELWNDPNKENVLKIWEFGSVTMTKP